MYLLFNPQPLEKGAGDLRFSLFFQIQNAEISGFGLKIAVK